jgi:hypothetical protein
VGVGTAFKHASLLRGRIPCVMNWSNAAHILGSLFVSITFKVLKLRRFI